MRLAPRAGAGAALARRAARSCELTERSADAVTASAARARALAADSSAPAAAQRRELELGVSPLQLARLLSSSTACSSGASAGLRAFHALRGAAREGAEAPALQPAPAREEEFEIEVLTGEVRGAGSKAGASITLFGDGGESEEVELAHGEDSQGFLPGQTLRWRIRLPAGLGTLRSARVRLHADEGGHEGWFLQELRVRALSPPAAAAAPAPAPFTVFRAAAWLGHGDSGGQDFPKEIEVDADSPGAGAPGAAGAAAPHHPPLARPLRWRAGGAAVPPPDKMKAGARAVLRAGNGHGGEDAYLIQGVGAGAGGSGGLLLLGVADGVYEWRHKGIDAGLFSRGLMDGAAAALARGCASAAELLAAAYAAAMAAGLQGSSTACLALVDAGTGHLHSATIGDSGYLLMSGAAAGAGAAGAINIKYRSPHQEHEFGRPFQLGHHAASDAPGDAMVTSQAVAAGDVVVMGSDGLWDNLHDAEIAAAVAAGLAAGEAAAPAALARRVLAAAFERSTAKSGDTPYAQAASEEFNMVYSGGKRDDITVVVAVLEEGPAAAAAAAAAAAQRAS